MRKQGALEISFGWLFALFAGLVILFLAIYFGSKLIGSSDETTSAKIGKEITILLSPLETSFESAQTTTISFTIETRINNTCNNLTLFGEQSLQIDQKRLNKWTETDTEIISYNKYIFSDSETTGKTFYLFSKPFRFPFKIADLIYLTSEEKVYCFVGAPKEVKEELSDLNQKNIEIENCSEESLKVCFSGDCDIRVNYQKKTVEKNNKIVYFYDFEDSNALMYAGIFSDKEIYECQIQRLMDRLKELTALYTEKEKIIVNAGCESNLGEKLTEIGNLANNLESSRDLMWIEEKIGEIETLNSRRECSLW